MKTLSQEIELRPLQIHIWNQTSRTVENKSIDQEINEDVQQKFQSPKRSVEIIQAKTAHFQVEMFQAANEK